MKNLEVVATTTPTTTPQPIITLTLESTGIILGALVSFSILVAGFTKIVTNFNLINISIKDLREDLNANTKALSQLNVLHSEVLNLDKKFDLHQQDYINYKDSNLLQLNGLEKQIGHNWSKTEKALAEQKGEIKDIQGFLQKHHFCTRDHSS